MEADSREALPGVTVKIKGTSIGTVTDSNGEFILSNVEIGTVLEIRHLGYNDLDHKIQNYNNIEISLEPAELLLQEMVVIGSRSFNRSILETPVPVDILPLASMANELPRVELTQILHYTVPSFNSNQTSISDGTDHIDPASLRGLGPDQVLVLINGKRRHPSSLVNINGTLGRGSAGTDFNSIPVAAIERIEILRDGAAAQYGSDAIAGVINVVLKSAPSEEKLTLGLTSGIFKEGDGETYQLSSNYGKKLGKKGFVNLTGNLNYRGTINRAGEYNGKIFLSGGGYDTLLEKLQDEDSMRFYGKDRSDFNLKIGGAQLLNAGFMVNLKYPISESTSIYSFSGINYRNGQASGFYRYPVDGRNVRAIYPTGFLPEIHTNIMDRAICVGLESKINEWHFDLSHIYGSNAFNYQVENSLNASMLSASPTSFDAGGFEFRQNTTNLNMSRFYQTILSGFNMAFGGEFRVDNYIIKAGEEASWKNYGFVNEVDTLPDGTLYLTNRVRDILGKPGGAQVFPGFRPENELDKLRTNIGGYLDMELDLSRQFMIGTALRAEHYSDFGNTVNGKFTMRYQFIPSVAFRGAVSTGFRAPSLHQLYFNTVSTNFIDGVPYEVGTFSNDSRAAQVLGIPNLKEETSTNVSAGILYNLDNGLSISFDAYQININDRIVLTGNFSGVDPNGDVDSDGTVNQLDVDSPGGTLKDYETYTLLNSVGANSARFFSNTVDTKTKGLDVVTSYTIEVGSGKLIMLLAANFSETSLDGPVKTSDLLSEKGDVYFDRREKGRLEELIPKSKIGWTMQYQTKKIHTLLHFTRFGESIARTTSKHTLPSGTFYDPEYKDERFSPKIVTDLTATYNFSSQISWSLGVNNLFDVYPDKLYRNSDSDHLRSELTDNTSRGRFLYTPVQQGFTGAYYYTRLNFVF